MIWKNAAAVAALVMTGTFATGASAATWTLGQWYQFSGNDHYYSVQQIVAVDGQGGWTIARDQATALSAPGAGATLATIDSAEVSAFVFAGIDSAAFWTLDIAGNNEGPYLGGYQTSTDNEPGGNWAWVNGDAWSYTQWNPQEPNNSNGNENILQLFASGNNRSGNWNDGGGTGAYGITGLSSFYIAESKFIAPPAVPEPASWALMVAGFGILGAGLRRRSSVALRFV
jgi:hypothetical protein